MTKQRVLITGSRNWEDDATIAFALREMRNRFGDDLLIVHGDCPSGADFITKLLCIEMGIDQEMHPGDWKRHGKKAGPIRNQAMVDLGAVRCLAFPMLDSRGTLDCMMKARAAGIEVINYGPDPLANRSGPVGGRIDF